MGGEDQVVHDVLVTLGQRQDVYCWRNNTGALRNHAGRLIRFGVPGSADVLCVLAPWGTLVALECKRPGGGVVSAAQRAWKRTLEARGGRYFVVRSGSEAVLAVSAVIQSQEQDREAVLNDF